MVYCNVLLCLASDNIGERRSHVDYKGTIYWQRLNKPELEINRLTMRQIISVNRLTMRLK